MLMIRLQRVGRRNHAEFRVVVTEHTRAAKSSNYVEIVGRYDPHTNTAVVDETKVKGWLAKGAQPSDTVHNILVSQKVIAGKKRNVLPKKTVVAKDAPAEAPAADAAPAEAPAAAAE